MAKDVLLRDELIFQLTVGHAHMAFADAVAHFPEDKMNEKFTNGDYTFWHLLEHIRRTQQDILDFMVSETYKEPVWPKDYWPGKNEKATKKDWDKTVTSFAEDQKKLIELVKDPTTDLFKKIERGTGQTVAREILVIVDHNAYHIGEFSIMRQVLGAWDKDHQK